MLWLGAHFPDFGLEVFAASQTTPSQRPQVLVEANRVLLRNSAAVAAGIALGSTLATAHSIAPKVVHHNRDVDKEQARLRFLAETLYRFTSQVSLQPPCSLLLEISGSLQLFGDHAALSQQVQTVCETLGHRAMLHTGETPLAALLLARSQAQSIEDVSLHHAQWHLSLPAAKGKPAGMTERLANMGIHTLGPLLALPQTELAHRFGAELVDFLRRLTGEQPDPQENILPRETFASSLHLLNPINSKDALLFPMARLLGELQLWLIGRQLGAEQIRWHFSSGSGHSKSFPVTLAREQQRRDAFLNLTRLKLEQTELPADVLSLKLQVDVLVPWQASGPELLLLTLSSQESGRTHTDPSELVDQLRARLGDGACYGIRPVAQHSPEQAWCQVPPNDVPHSAKSSNNSLLSAKLSKPSKRPLWFFNPPRPAARQDLTLLRGPERIQGDWWQQFICRDYYVAKHSNGAECWAYVDAQQHWYLHGYFA